MRVPTCFLFVYFSRGTRLQLPDLDLHLVYSKHILQIRFHGQSTLEYRIVLEKTPFIGTIPNI